jgi:hypothetical protein
MGRPASRTAGNSTFVTNALPINHKSHPCRHQTALNVDDSAHRFDPLSTTNAEKIAIMHNELKLLIRLIHPKVLVSLGIEVKALRIKGGRDMVAPGARLASSPARAGRRPWSQGIAGPGTLLGSRQA